MRELMADCSNAAYEVGVGVVVLELVNLVAAGVLFQLFAVVFGESCSSAASVWPNRTLVCAGGLSVASVDNEDEVNVAAVVPVILCHVNTFVMCLLKTLVDHINGLFLVVVAIIFIVGRHHVRAFHVEGEVETSVALGEEIVFHAAHKSVAGAESLFVHHVGVERVVVAVLKLLVRELGKENEATLTAQKLVANASHTLGACVGDGAELGAALACLFLEGVGRCERVGAVLVGHVDVAILVFVEVDGLVALKLCIDRCSVCECDVAPYSRKGGHGECHDRCQQKERHQQDCFFHFCFLRCIFVLFFIFVSLSCRFSSFPLSSLSLPLSLSLLNLSFSSSFNLYFLNVLPFSIKISPYCLKAFSFFLFKGLFIFYKRSLKFLF